MKNHTLNIIKSSRTLPCPRLKQLWCGVYFACVQPRREKWDVMYKIGSKGGNWGNKHFLKVWPLTKIYSRKETLNFAQCVAKSCHCYNSLQNFTTFEFWSQLSLSYLVSLRLSNVVPCYSMCLKCLWMVSSVVTLVRTHLGAFRGHNIFIVVKQHFWVTITHTSLVVLGECV